jgi:hypothetical protein
MLSCDISGDSPHLFISSDIRNSHSAEENYEGTPGLFTHSYYTRVRRDCKFLRLLSKTQPETLFVLPLSDLLSLLHLVFSDSN